MFKKKQKQEILPNNSLINAISPIGLEFFRNHLFIGENKAKVYGIVKYKDENEYGFLSKITNMQNTYTSIYYKPIDATEFISALSNNIATQKLIVDSAREAIDVQRAENSMKNSENMMKQVDQNSETIGNLSVCIMPIGDEEEKFEKSCKNLLTKAATIGARARVLPALQKEGFKQISPFYTYSKDILKITAKPVPLASFIGGFPFASSGLNDGDGYILGNDSNGGLIILDLWKRSGDRTNSNLVIMGKAGQGKSTAVKQIIKQEYINGTKIIIVDPENEYKTLTKRLGGDIVDSNGKTDISNIINPFEIRPVPEDDEDDFEEEKLYKDDGNGEGALALHLKTLELFFSLYLPDISMSNRARLKKCIVKLYNEFAIYWDTDISVLDSEDFPIMKDLYDLIEREKSLQTDIDIIKSYEEILNLLYDSVFGSDQFLFNGYSNFKATSRITCIDTTSMSSFEDNLRSTLYFNILTWAWMEMSRNREEKVMLVCDEAYLMIDEKMPRPLIYLRNIEKRSRKYESSIIVISHSVNDFLSENIRQYGQALMDIPAYKIIFGTDGKNLDETKKLYNFTNAEEELLLRQQRAVALFMCGSKKMQLNFKLTEEELELFGKAGGR